MFTQKYLRIPVLALLALALAAGLAAAGDERSEEFDFPAGGRLELDFPSGGSFSIEGWDRETASVTWSEYRNDLDDYDTEFDLDAEGLKITSEPNRRLRQTSLHFEIRVPRRVELRFETAGGSVELADLEGTFRGRTAGGQLEFRDLKGRVRITTGGGQIQIEDCELDGEVTTGGGEVLLKNVAGDLEARSGGGEVRYVNVRGPRGERRAPTDCDGYEITDGTILISNAGGSIMVREAPEGACVKTGGGGVRVRDADRFVVAGTGGGDVEVEIGAGPVDVSTGAGDVEVFVSRSVESGDIEIVSGLGNVDLVVPKGFSAELDLSIAYTKSSRQDYSIDCDLPFEEERTKEWESEGIRGRFSSPKKYIYGTGTVGDGAHRIRIRTTNGDITVRER